jgi:hypothetical protein
VNEVEKAADQGLDFMQGKPGRNQSFRGLIESQNHKGRPQEKRFFRRHSLPQSRQGVETSLAEPRLVMTCANRGIVNPAAFAPRILAHLDLDPDSFSFVPGCYPVQRKRGRRGHDEKEGQGIAIGLEV